MSPFSRVTTKRIFAASSLGSGSICAAGLNADAKLDASEGQKGGRPKTVMAAALSTTSVSAPSAANGKRCDFGDSGFGGSGAGSAVACEGGLRLWAWTNCCNWGFCGLQAYAPWIRSSVLPCFSAQAMSSKTTISNVSPPAIVSRSAFSCVRTMTTNELRLKALNSAVCSSAISGPRSAAINGLLWDQSRRIARPQSLFMGLRRCSREVHTNNT